MHTVVETPEYLRAAKKAGMTDLEREIAVDFLSDNPDAGNVIEGSGGARKVRTPKEGKGKSGGYRLITYYVDADTPVFLITVISKGQQANLTGRQKQAVRESAKAERSDRRRK
jgi:mRNA-degrading endonuclease RelE of RelBE toxin-antitoxin system